MKNTVALITLTLTLTMLSACGSQSKDTKTAEKSTKTHMEAKKDPIEGMRVLYDNQDKPQNEKLKFLKLEHAATDEQKKIGLAGRESLGAEEGMIFDFQNAGRHRFWMKGMLFPLDIIYVGGDGMIVDIVTLELCDTDPCPIYMPQAPAQYVIEVNKGYAESHKLEIGEFVNVDLFVK